MVGHSDEEPVVLQERKQHVLVLTINRPSVRNSINASVHSALGQALELAENDPEVRAIVLTGAGDKAFSAGADLKALARGERLEPEDRTERGWGFAGVVRHPISKPMIAAVNGFALGGGTELALACDIVVAAEHAAFGLPEVKRGLFAAAGGAFRIVQQLPPKIGMELLLTGEPVSATRAMELGLVNYVVEPQAVMEKALAIADLIAANAPLSVQASKRLAMGIHDGRIAGDDNFWAANKREAKVVMLSQDAREGPRAFAEKRAPNWQAR